MFKVIDSTPEVLTISQGDNSLTFDRSFIERIDAYFQPAENVRQVDKYGVVVATKEFRRAFNFEFVDKVERDLFFDECLVHNVAPSTDRQADQEAAQLAWIEGLAAERWPGTSDQFTQDRLAQEWNVTW